MKTNRFAGSACSHTVSFSRMEKIVWPILSVLVMLAVFYFSSQNGPESASQSSRFARLLQPWLDEKTATFVVRKGAHFTIYLLMGFCVHRSLLAWNVQNAWSIAAAAGICMLYATSDEFHQTFVAARSGSLRDILIDTSGGLCGSLISWLIFQSKRDKIL